MNTGRHRDQKAMGNGDGDWKEIGVTLPSTHKHQESTGAGKQKEVLRALGGTCAAAYPSVLNFWPLDL